MLQRVHTIGFYRLFTTPSLNEDIVERVVRFPRHDNLEFER